MEQFLFLCAAVLWVLPLGLNGGVTPEPTDGRTGEGTTANRTATSLIPSPQLLQENQTTTRHEVTPKTTVSTGENLARTGRDAASSGTGGAGHTEPATAGRSRTSETPSAASDERVPETGTEPTAPVTEPTTAMTEPTAPVTARSSAGTAPSTTGAVRIGMDVRTLASDASRAALLTSEVTAVTPTASSPKSLAADPSSTLTAPTARNTSSAETGFTAPIVGGDVTTETNSTTATTGTSAEVTTRTKGNATLGAITERPVAATTTAMTATTATTATTAMTATTAKIVLPAKSTAAAVVTTKKKPIVRPTKSTKKTAPETARNHGAVVAVLIGGSLGLMMGFFFAVWMRKRQLQKKRLENTDWAGPSPFLESGDGGGGGDGQDVNMRGSNRISLAGFLPGRLSTRMSLLQRREEDLNMVDVQAGSTFGIDPGEARQSNGPGVAPGEEDAPQTPPSKTPPDNDDGPKMAAPLQDTNPEMDDSVGRPANGVPLALSKPGMAPPLDDANPVPPMTGAATMPPAPPSSSPHSNT